jgi:Ca2+-binding RTX toxin-like protein
MEVQGGGGSDRIRTGDGADRITGGRGNDAIDAGGGDDEVHAVDRRRDRVNCGDGEDVAEVDPSDLVTGCETTRRVRGARRRGAGPIG